MTTAARSAPLIIWSMAILLAGISFVLDGARGFNPADEGFVWHAAWRTQHGDVPLLDFLSYDPGRHYWQAAWMWLLGGGIFALRLGDTVFQAIGLACGLFSLTRLTQNWLSLFVCGSLLMLGMTPSYKLFEPSLAMVMVLIGVRLIEQPDSGRYFQAGLLAGLAGFIGRNLGIYAVVAFGIIMVTIRMRAQVQRRKDLVAFCGGLLLGYSPALLMMLVIPGFAAALLDSMIRIIEVGAGNNLGLPVPWPWTVDFDRLNWFRSFSAMGRGITYVCIVLFLPAAAIFLWQRRKSMETRHALLASSWAVSLVFAHHAFGRAGPSHLAQSFHPFLIGILAIGPVLTDSVQRRVYFSIAGALCGIAVVGVIVMRSFVSQWMSASNTWTTIQLGNYPVTMPVQKAKDVIAFERIYEQCIGAGNQFFVAPNWPAAYPILGAKSPTWDNYFMFRETDRRQTELIKQFKDADVRWVLLSDVALDNKEDRRFRNTYPLVYQWIEQNFDEVRTPVVPEGYKVMHKSEFNSNAKPLCNGWALR
jgi:hypothetical protein